MADETALDDPIRGPRPMCQEGASVADVHIRRRRWRRR
jgi:hypothetical protein